MKKYAFVTAILVLTLSLLTGCGCTNKDSGMVTMPSGEATILPTNIPETTAPTERATAPATIPATDPTDATGMDGTDGMTGETQDGTTAETGISGKSRMR